jgi:hypothetical protein
VILVTYLFDYCCVDGHKEYPKNSIIVPVYKKGDKTECINYRGISLLSFSYKILSKILLSRLSPYIDEIIGDYQCGFWRNVLTTHQILFFFALV